MSLIVGVHGVGNYHRNQTADAISAAWTNSLTAGFPAAPPAAMDVTVAYYAHTLRMTTSQGDDDPDLLDLDTQEAILAWLALDPDQPTDLAQGRTTRALRDALEWFATKRGLDSRTVRLFTSLFFREVVTYLNPSDPRPRANAQQVVHDTIATHQPRIVIAHSLGSVIAWETLWTYPATTPIDLFLTLGSPLAMPHVDYNKLNPRPAEGRPSRPPNVRRWINLADTGDLVAVPRLLSRYFDGIETDLEPTIGAFDFHRVKNYLRNPTTAAIVASALAD